MNRRVFCAGFCLVVFFCSINLCLAGEEEMRLIEPSPAVEKSWAPGDALVTNPTFNEVNPSMTSAPNGDLYVAVEETATNWINLYRSTDGGDTWMLSGGFASGDDTRNPSLAYAEHSNGEKWLYVAYEQVTTAGDNRNVRIYRRSLVGSPSSWITVDGPFIMASTSDQVHPQIITDWVDWGDLYYVYVTYAKYAIDYYPVYSARTTDRGAIWSTPLNVTGGSENTGWPARPEIAYGFSGLFITFVKPGWNVGSSWSNQIWVTESSDDGVSFATPVQLTDWTNNVFHPAVAAAHGADSLVVAYTIDFGSNTDVAYNSSTDGGTTWGAIGPLPWTMDHESSVDLAVSNSGGHFHAAYKHEAMVVDEIWYSSAAVADPTAWSSIVVVNGGNTASATYPRPTIATMPGLPSAGEAAIAWTDYRGAFYDAYFDTAAIFADGFESGDTSAWSSSVP
jgi:hypothetical protein